MKNNINILFSGDFAPCRRFEKLVLEKKETIFDNALTLIQNADISFVNLECSLTTYKAPVEKSGPALQANPKCIEALKDFSLIGLANNHVMDLDTQGLKDTLEACSSINVPTVGAGLNIKESQKFQLIEKDGLKVAIIALAEHEFNQASENKAGSAPMDAIDNFYQITEAKKQANIVIVTLHAGNEYFQYPRPNLRKLCKHYINLGVEAVVCHHPHVPGAYEYHNGKPIFYSIGNLIFDNENPPKEWDEGFMVNLSIDKENRSIENIELIPYIQSVELNGIQLLKDEKKVTFLKRLESYREILENETKYQNEWKNFIEEEANNYIMKNYVPHLFRGIGFLCRNTPFIKLYFNSKSILPRLNMIRCQSHREVLKCSLELKAKQELGK